MNDTFVKTIDAEPDAVARQLLRMDAYRELAESLDGDAETSITVTPALEGTSVAIRVASYGETDAITRRWPAIAADAAQHARGLLRELAERMTAPSTRTLAA